MVLPGYKGSTLRGGFGATFRRIVCVVKGKECADCLLKGTCVYSYVFETPPPPDTRIMRKYEAAPHPFIIEPPLERRRGYQPGDEISFGLTLIGRAIDYLPYFIYTFDELGKTGLGKGRGGYELRSVLNHGSENNGATNHEIYSSATKTIRHFDTHSLALEPPSSDESAQEISRLTLRFLTPTRIAYNGRLTDNIEFHVIIRNLLRRISLLAYFHGRDGASPALDFKHIIEQSKAVRVIARRLRRYDWQRYSGRQERKIDMGGFVGEVSFEGAIKPFLTLITAGEVLHVGKGTVFGLGRYEIVQD